MSGAGGVGLLFSNARPRAKTIARLVPECEIASARPHLDRRVGLNSLCNSAPYANRTRRGQAAGGGRICISEGKFGINAARRPGETRSAACYGGQHFQENARPRLRA
jgi:hypothetical protein